MAGPISVRTAVPLEPQTHFFPRNLLAADMPAWQVSQDRFATGLQTQFFFFKSDSKCPRGRSRKDFTFFRRHAIASLLACNFAGPQARRPAGPQAHVCRELSLASHCMGLENASRPRVLPAPDPLEVRASNLHLAPGIALQALSLLHRIVFVTLCRRSPAGHKPEPHSQVLFCQFFI